MKKKILIAFILSIFLFVNSTISIGSSAITYLYLDAIKIEDSNIEILSDELLIDTTTSKVENTINLKNTSDKEIEMNLVFPLENEQLGISIKNLVIKLNDVQVEYTKGDDGKYIVKTRISANSGKRINIEYYTENDLQKARLIKCNFDNLTGKKVGKLKVDIKIDDKSIPLVEKIYPGHYTFKDNTISVEYYNYEVNTITKEIIVKKETFNNLLYGREIDLDDEERKIISTWYTTGDVNVKDDYRSENSIVKNIIDYKKIKNGSEITTEPSEPLLYGLSEENTYSILKRDLKGKNICIDFVESEGDKELYVDKYVEGEEEQIVTELVKEPERKILQTELTGNAYQGKRGAKIIFVNQGIEGECLNATEQEKVSYINQINADMYIRIAIYDGAAKKSGFSNINDEYLGRVGYYDNNNLEIAKTFAFDASIIKEENWNGQYDKYETYDDYVKNYRNDYCKNVLIKLNNEDIANKCEVPTVMQFIGNRETKDGKYVVNFDILHGIYNYSNRGINTTNAALQTSQAKKMISSNKEKNSNIKTEIENQIANLSIIDDEQKIQQEIEEQKGQEELKKQQIEEEKKAKERKEQQKILNKHIIVFSSIGLGITFCIVIIIIENKKKDIIKKEYINNGRKENDKK